MGFPRILCDAFEVHQLYVSMFGFVKYVVAISCFLRSLYCLFENTLLSLLREWLDYYSIGGTEMETNYETNGGNKNITVSGGEQGCVVR